MRAVLQRVAAASVEIDGERVAAIGKGLCVLLGIAEADNDETIAYMLDKIINMRIFEDENGKMNLSLADVRGGLLVVPNFTLYGDARKGRRPGYTDGAKPETAEAIFERFKQAARAAYPGELGFGVFRADMLVEIKNDGPVTLLLDSDRLF